MRNGKRLIAGVIGLVLTAGFVGCQVQDGALLTEADRSLEPSATAQEILQLIDQVITDPAVGKSARSQFETIVKVLPKKPADAQQKATSLTAFILKHYAGGKWSDPGGVGTGEVVAAIYAYVGLLPEDADRATACVPNVDCELFATQDEELALIQIPGDQVQVPFVLVITRLPDDFAQPPLFPMFFEFTTIPEGITFTQSTPSGSLTLSQFDDGPVAALCALDSEDPLGTPVGAEPGVNLFLAHQEDGVWESLPFVPVTTLDCTSASSGIGESIGLWSSPIDLAIGPMLDLLSPATARAGGKGLGGAISSFSPYGSLYTGPNTTTTTLSIVGGQTTFFAGDSIIFRAVVEPPPHNEDNGIVLFFATVPPSGSGVPAEEVVDGEAIQAFVCGSSRVPFGSHGAVAEFTGTVDHLGSESEPVAYECLAEPVGE